MLFKLVIKRVFSFVFLLFLLSYLCFLMIYFSKGSVANAINLQASKEFKTQIENNLNLNKPLNEQYFLWLKGLIKGDLGRSLINGESVNLIIKERLNSSLILALISLFILFVLSLFLGLLSVIYKGKFVDKFLHLFSMSFLATPSFAIALIFILFFSVYLKILPSSNIADIGFEDDFLNRVKHLILPVSVLVLSNLALFLRFFRTILLEILNQKFIEAAFVRGLSVKIIYFKLALKSALAPMCVYFAANCVGFLMNLYVIEGVFNYAGLGNLVIQSIYFKDYPVILAVIILSFFAATFINLLAEICVYFLDARKIYA